MRATRTVRITPARIVMAIFYLATQAICVLTYIWQKILALAFQYSQAKVIAARTSLAPHTRLFFCESPI
jgi:hypothetical protein